MKKSLIALMLCLVSIGFISCTGNTKINPEKYDNFLFTASNDTLVFHGISNGIDIKKDVSFTSAFRKFIDEEDSIYSLPVVKKFIAQKMADTTTFISSYDTLYTLLRDEFFSISLDTKYECKRTSSYDFIEGAAGEISIYDSLMCISFPFSCQNGWGSVIPTKKNVYYSLKPNGELESAGFWKD